MEVIGDSDSRCVVCMDIDGGEIYQCPEGHLICGTCKGKLREVICPICRSVDIENRNRALENIVAQQIKKRKVEVDDDVKAVGDAAQQLQAKLNKLKEENKKLHIQTCHQLKAKLEIAKTLDVASLIYCKDEDRFYETKGNSFVGLDIDLPHSLRGKIIGWRPFDEYSGDPSDIPDYFLSEIYYLVKFADNYEEMGSQIVEKYVIPQTPVAQE